MQIDFLAPNPAERNATLRQIGPRANLRVTEKIPGSKGDLVWLHGDTEDRADWQLDPAASVALREYVVNGGRVLLTGPAARLVGPIAGEEQLPEIRRSVEPEAATPSPRGAMPMPGHPLFHRSVGGRMFYERRPGQEYAEAVYADGRHPEQGDVIAVEKVEDGCSTERAVIVEYKLGSGRLVSVCAPLSFVDLPMDATDSTDSTDSADGSDAPADPWLENRARFVGDLLDYAMNDHAAERGAPWRSRETGAWIRWDASKLLTQPDPVPAPEDEGVLAKVGETLDYELSLADGQVLYGDTGSEAFEVWRQPFRAFRDFGYAFTDANSRWISANTILSSCRVHCDRVVYRFCSEGMGEGIDVECCVALAPRGFQVRWQNLGDAPIRIRVSGVASMVLASPYPTGSLGDLDLVSVAKGGELRVADPVLGYGAWLRFDRIPKCSSLADRSTADGTVVAFTREFTLHTEGDLIMEVGGIVRDRFAVGAPFEQKAAARQPTEPVITVGDDEVDAALAGLHARAVAALCPYDGQSRGLTTGRLRTGEHAAAPAHFVGRGCFDLGISQLAWGNSDAVREHLELLQRFQDSQGQVFDQLAVSGVIKTGDEAATVEFVRLVASYLAWTGDHESVFELWPAVRRALAWLEQQECEGERNVALGAAFSAGSRVAEFVGESDTAQTYTARTAAIADQLESDGEGDQPVVSPAAQSGHTAWRQVAVELCSAWRDGTPWDRVVQAEGLRTAVEQLLGLSVDQEKGELVLSPGFDDGPAVVKFADLTVVGRMWSGELRRDAHGMELFVQQYGPALEILCERVITGNGLGKTTKIVFDSATSVRFSMPTPVQD